MIFLVLFVAIFSSFSVYAEPVLDSWVVYSSPGVPIYGEEVKFPVEGKSVGAIKPPVVQLDKETKAKDINKYSFGWLDYYYLAQTINAKKYRGEHLHISGYLKLDTDDVRQRIEKYSSWREDRKLEYFKSLEAILDGADNPIALPVNFDKRFLEGNEIDYDRLVESTEIKVNVILTTENGTVTQDSNNDFFIKTQQWQRMNVEIDVPVNCKAITIVVWMKGYGNLFVDDFVLSEQGPEIDTAQRSGGKIKYYGKFKEILDTWVKNSKDHPVFDNLGFEKYKMSN